jgi:hypothetical protein
MSNAMRVSALRLLFSMGFFGASLLAAGKFCLAC